MTKMMLANTNSTTITKKCKTTTLMKTTSNLITKEQKSKKLMEKKTIWKTKTKMLSMMVKFTSMMKCNKTTNSSSTLSRTNMAIIKLEKQASFKPPD
jgi:hypothetical protein